MNILDISHNDDLVTVIRKCNQNFKQLVFESTQDVKRQGRSSDSSAEAMVAEAVDDITNVIVPNEVSGQIANQDIPGKVSDAIDALDVPQMVEDEVAAQMTVPPVGSYLMATSNPSSTYSGTTWQQAGTITTDNSVVITLWERTL